LQDELARHLDTIVEPWPDRATSGRPTTAPAKENER